MEREARRQTDLLPERTFSHAHYSHASETFEAIVLHHLAVALVSLFVVWDHYPGEANDIALLWSQASKYSMPNPCMVAEKMSIPILDVDKQHRGSTPVIEPFKGGSDGKPLAFVFL